MSINNRLSIFAATSMLLFFAGCAKEASSVTKNDAAPAAQNSEQTGLDLTDGTILNIHSISRPAGNGCKNLDIDSTALKVGILRFRDLMKESHMNGIDSAIDRNNCGLSIPVNVPAGKRMVLSDAKMQVQVNLASLDEAKARSEWFFAGSQSNPNQFNAVGPAQSQQNQNQNGIIAKSVCAQPQNLRLNESQQIQSKSGTTAGSILTSVIEVKISLEDCVTE